VTRLLGRRPHVARGVLRPSPVMRGRGCRGRDLECCLRLRGGWGGWGNVGGSQRGGQGVAGGAARVRAAARVSGAARVPGAARVGVPARLPGAEPGAHPQEARVPQQAQVRRECPATSAGAARVSRNKRRCGASVPQQAQVRRPRFPPVSGVPLPACRAEDSAAPPLIVGCNRQAVTGLYQYQVVERWPRGGLERGGWAGCGTG
jgi:hypothetical protein